MNIKHGITDSLQTGPHNDDNILSFDSKMHIFHILVFVKFRCMLQLTCMFCMFNMVYSV